MTPRRPDPIHQLEPAPTGGLRSRYTWLLLGLLALALVVPFVHGDLPSLAVLDVLSIGLIVASVAAVAKRRRHVIVAACLGLPSIALSVVALAGAGAGPDQVRAAVAHGSLTAFAAYTAVIVLVDVFGGERVTAEKIRGAVCVFFMMGATWAFAYLFLLDLDPGAISFPAIREATLTHRPRPDDVFYFSFSTLTSVGFGDVLPVSPPARALSWLEALAAELYLAVLVARLVGLHIAHGPAEAPRFNPALPARRR